MAAEYLGPEPANIEKEFQNEEETSNQEIPNHDKIEKQLEEEKNGINPLDYLQLCWKSDNSENSDEDSESEMGYMSPINLSSDDMNIDTSDSDESGSDEDNSDDDSNEDDSDGERQHSKRVLDLILAWMQHIYQEKLEEEIIVLRNCDGLIEWTHARFKAFRLLCREQINETIEQLNEGSILVPISKEKSEE